MRVRPATSALTGLLALLAHAAAAQYVDQAFVDCAPPFFLGTTQVGYDDPTALYAEAPGPGPGGLPRRTTPPRAGDRPIAA